MAESSDNGLELTSSSPMLRVQIWGARNQDLARLLEDIAGFFRNEAKDVNDRGRPDENLELLFKRSVANGEYVIISVRP